MGASLAGRTLRRKKRLLRNGSSERTGGQGLKSEHRNDPIIQGDPPLKRYRNGSFGIRSGGRSVVGLEYAGVPRRPRRLAAWALATVISLKQRYEGHASQAAAMALGVRATLAWVDS